MSIPDAVRSRLATLDVRDKNWSPALADAQREGAEVDLALTELSTPIFTLDLDAMAGNIATMRDWVDEHRASLAPHGKTTMCPALWHWQLEQGSWAITVANEAQLRVARDAGIPRVVVANQLLSPVGLGWLAGELDADPDFDVTVWVDSLAGVAQMTAALEAAGAQRPLPVCVELGADGGRTGIRDQQLAREVAAAVRQSPRLALRGVAGYEGAVPGDGEQKDVGIRQFLTRMADLFAELAPVVETPEPLLTAGGSAYFDLVAEVLAPATASIPQGRLLLRSGAFVLHDDGLYRQRTPAATRTGPDFTAAGHVWSRVISVPEPRLALLDVGKRDIPYDSGLPVLQKVITGAGPVDAPRATIVDSNDQHSYADLEIANSLQVGDVVRLGISHPCTMFDKWRSGLLIDGDRLRVRGAVETYF